jgi:hypothetical protein
VTFSTLTENAQEDPQRSVQYFHVFKLVHVVAVIFGFQSEEEGGFLCTAK